MQSFRPQVHERWMAHGPTARPMRPGRRLTVQPWEEAVLLHRGRLVTVLGPGGHRRWTSGHVAWVVDRRERILTVPTQEVPTADGITVKVTVTGRVKVVDAAAYLTAAQDSDDVLYLAVQVALRDLVATRSIDDLLAARAELGGQVLVTLADVTALGIVVEQLDLKDLILPTELKRAQGEVLIARAKGAAALERARGETAALRSLANAARLAADHPALLQLRLFEHLDASSGHTLVIGGPPLGAVGGTEPGSST